MTELRVTACLSGMGWRVGITLARWDWTTPEVLFNSDSAPLKSLKKIFLSLQVLVL